MLKREENLLNTKDIYSGKADLYVTGRPCYPPETVDFLHSALRISPATIIADIGAGTGIFTQYLLETGAYVFAVEPNQDMLERAGQQLNKYSNFKAINAPAEKTTLPSLSIDLISVAQALHWFATKQTKKEFERILRPGGSYLFLWNDRLKDYDDFHQGLEAILINNLETYVAQGVQDIKPQDLVYRFLGTKNFITQTLVNDQQLSKAGLLGRVFSSSYSPDIESTLGRFLRGRIESLFESHNTEGKVCIKYETTIICAGDTR